MNIDYETTLELEETGILWMDVAINADIQEGEPRTWEHPGCEPSAELCSVRVESFGAGDLKVTRSETNESCFLVLDQTAIEFVQADWESYETNILEEAGEAEEAFLADKYR